VRADFAWLPHPDFCFFAKNLNETGYSGLDLGMLLWSREANMLILLIILILLFGGGGGYYGYGRWGAGGGAGVSLGTILIIVLIVYLLGGLHY